MSAPVPHILIAAARKSSGKTSFSLGLARALANRGLVVQTFKKGPDYIDPLWLAQASGRPCYNLDFNTMSEGEIISTFADKSAGADIVIIETNKGLFDGLDVAGSDSNSQLAKLLASPIVLVLDTVGMTRGIAPLLHGYQTFDAEIKIAGVVLNKTGGPRHEEKLRAAIDHYNKLPVLGSLARNDAISVDERHLGLMTPGEVSAAAPIIDMLAEAVSDGVDLDEILAIAKTAGKEFASVTEKPFETAQPKVRIGIARDRAFGFYYPDDLEALENAGAELVFFSSMRDSNLPEVDGLFVGGGFPETHMRELEDNASLRGQIKMAIENGLPAYAECGGLMYLCNDLSWGDNRAEMVGVIPGTAVMNKRPQGRGFARLESTDNATWMTGNFAAHEFHYASLENLDNNLTYAWEVTRGHGIDGKRDGIMIKNLLASFCHLRHTAASPWAENFVRFVRQCKISEEK